MVVAHSATRILRFLSAGGLGVLLYYLVLYTLTDFIGVWYLASAAIASIVNWTSNFVLQKFWTFQNKDRKNLHKQAGIYAVMAIGLFGANLLLLYVLVDYLRLWYLGAQVIVTVLLTGVSFIITSRIFSDSVLQGVSMGEEFHIVRLAGGAVVVGLTKQEADLLLARQAFAEQYCSERGWDMLNLTADQFFEIRKQPGWQNPA
jgi:putative flippase GtrA